MKTKVAIYLSLIALLGAVLFQNIEDVTLQLLFIEFQIPLVLLMVIMFVLFSSDLLISSISAEIALILSSTQSQSP